ncbi:MAG TPA: DinB family protein [Acetobacteraceae bacterium]
MITPTFVQTMAQYNAEMNRRWYAAADRLTDAQRREDGGAFWGSVHGTLCHILWADRMWMSRFAGWDKPTVIQKDSAGLIADWGELSRARVADDARIIEWSEALTPEWLAQDLVWFSGGAGREMTKPRALTVTHLFNHQTHHRGQAHALLSRFGQDTRGTDLPFVM